MVSEEKLRGRTSSLALSFLQSAMAESEHHVSSGSAPYFGRTFIYSRIDLGVSGDAPATRAATAFAVPGHVPGVQEGSEFTGVEVRWLQISTVCPSKRAELWLAVNLQG